MKYLKIILSSNAIFSLLTGVSLVFFCKTIAIWFGKQNITVFWSIGIALLFFSYFVFTQIKQPKPNAVIFIIIQDFLWVLASIIIITFGFFDISSLGILIIDIVAFIVLFFAIGQSIGIVQTSSLNRIKKKN